MRTRLANTIILLLLLAGTTAASEIRVEQVHFNTGETASINGEIKGYNIVDYQLRANPGQTIATNFQPANPAANFNGLPPGSQDVANNPKPAEKPRVERPFKRTLELQGICFQILSANDSSINTLTIQPAGLEIDNAKIIREIDGTVTGAEVADLNADNSPEIYIYITSAGSGSYGTLVAYAANRRKSLSDIYLPPIADHKDAAKGYMGHDQFAVLEGVLGRRFPIYHTFDSNAEPTGGMRQIQYKLFPGEAGWILRMDRITEF